ncbi:hypothetical protein [Bifidobacterium breve]|uniref:hypothetical protein n=1 Tax=Bifidobacterium breve TaxID=1685 RepID=UPI0021640BFF|nr:hypothetical protein [Bifidobacterium breve]
MIRFEYEYPARVKTKSGDSILFDPANNGAHRGLLERQLDKWRAAHPEAWEATLEFIDRERHVAVLVDRQASSVDMRDDSSLEINLSAEHSKPSKGAEVQAVYETKYPGYRLTVFHPYEGKALLEQLSDAQATARAQIATELGLHDWDLRVSPLKDGGWKVLLDGGITYQPSKMDARMEKACLTVGRLGWWFEADPDTGIVEIHPGEPPTFPKLVPFPFDRIGDPAVRDRTPFGIRLARPGEPGKPAFVDWTQSLGLLVAGLSGGGKALPMDARIPVPACDRFPDGWARNRDLKVGDRVYGRDGRIIPIANFSDIENRPVYRLTLSDGQKLECADSHLWTVSDSVMRRAMSDERGRERREQTIRLVSRLRVEADKVGTGVRGNRRRIAIDHGLPPNVTQQCAERHGLVGADGLCDVAELLRAVADERESYIMPGGAWAKTTDTTLTARQIAENPTPHGKCWGIRVAEPIDNPVADLPLGPYFLGAWLGDGISRVGAICLNDDDEPYMQPDILDSLGGAIRRSENGHGAHTWFYDMDDGRILVTELRKLGLYMDKHVPAAYLRASRGQRLALLQGLMDTDGTIGDRGSCELCFTNRRLAETSLELIRSLGIVAGMSAGPAGYTRDGEHVDAGTRYRIGFTTTMPVFRLPRKRMLLPDITRPTQDWLYIVACEPTGEIAPVRCLNVATYDHLFLMGGFVPTHNSVTINDVTTLGIGTGAELYVIDHSTKATDYYWCRPWIADRGWGADSLLQTAGLLKWLLDDIEDGGERARAWKSHGWQNWYDDLSDEDKRRYPYRLIVVDELSQLTVGAKDATSLPKNPLPPVMERMFEQQVKALILSTLIRILQIGRAYGYRVVVATQIASSTTGMPPALRGNLGNKVIMGAKVNDAQKNLIFNIAKDVPDIPANVIDEGVSKGAGLSEMEGQPPYDFKSAFPMLGHHAGVAALGRALAERIGLPDGIGLDEYLDSLDKDTPSNPDFEQRVMERIRFPEAESYLRFPFLRAIKDKWDEAIDEYGGSPASDPDDGGDAGTAPVGEPVRPPAGPEPSGPLMDAAELARIMRQG